MGTKFNLIRIIFRFYPLSQIIDVETKPLFDLTFSQLKATITGDIHCIFEDDCRSLKVLLKSTQNEDSRTATIQSKF